jgi:hypothetical protein
MLTKDQIRWASEHDWFAADNGDGTINVKWDDGTIARWNSTFRDLRFWAGY